jgi:hypothetical protein
MPLRSVKHVVITKVLLVHKRRPQILCPIRQLQVEVGVGFLLQMIKA